MGHQVEYLIDLPPKSARDWLSTLPGWWDEPDPVRELPHGVFEWDGLSLHAEIGPTACQVSVPQIKYSWLIADHTPSVERIARLEGWLSKSLPCVRAVRVDELLWLDWKSSSLGEWWQWPDPVLALRGWLLSTGQDPAYFRLLPDAHRHAEPDAAPDGRA